MMQRETTEKQGRWLSPSAALTRFNPPQVTAPAGRTPPVRQISRFGFRVGPMHLLIKPSTLSEVVIQTPIYPLPNVPSWFLGVLNRRGNLLPVFDLYQLLETGHNNGNKQHTVLLLDQGSEAVGLPIDGLPHSVALERALRNVPPLPEALQEHVPAAYITQGTIWLEFDHHSFFTALGQHVVA